MLTSGLPCFAAQIPSLRPTARGRGNIKLPHPPQRPLRMVLEARDGDVALMEGDGEDCDNSVIKRIVSQAL